MVLSARSHHNKAFLLLRLKRFLKLGMPTCIGILFAWARSASDLVGELRHCMVKLLAARSAVPSTLMSKWSAVSHRLTKLQSPV